MARRGLWDNIHAKRERIKRGSGERMRRPGEEGRPSAADFKAASESVEKTEKHTTNPNLPSSRFDASDELVSIYKKDTPGQSTAKTIKRVVREATYQGREVKLNTPMKGDVKKSKVYVKKGDKVVKVNFGDPNMSIKKDQPSRKSSYCARSSGQGNLTDKTSANYWSRRAWNC